MLAKENARGRKKDVLKISKYEYMLQQLQVGEDDSESVLRDIRAYCMKRLGIVLADETDTLKEPKAPIPDKEEDDEAVD